MKLKVENTKFQTPNTNKGITLIALVITIVVLLILAGVAISMAINSDGLFGKANEAAEGWNTAVKEEGTAMGGLLLDLDKASPTPVTVSETVPDEWKSNSNISSVATSVAGKVPVPTGFVVSEIAGENTIGNGLVIYQVDKTTAEAEGFWTNEDEDGYLTCQTGYNQYVWIPVADINSMVMCKSNTANSVCNLKLIGDTLKCTVHTTTATELCGRLYVSKSFVDRSQTWEEAGRREPDILSGTSTDEYTVFGADTDSNTGNLATFTTNMTNDFKNMATSVAKYGGFYVGRYEAGENGASKRNQKVLTTGTTGTDVTVVASNGNGWYGLYNTLRDTAQAGVVSHMIYGSQWDQIINFIGEEARTGHATRQLSTQQKTGYKNDKNVMSNIYDLEGNNLEWTAEANEYAVTTDGFTSYNLARTGRGGFFFLAGRGQFCAATFRYDGLATAPLKFCGTRRALYVE